MTEVCSAWLHLEQENVSEEQGGGLSSEDAMVESLDVCHVGIVVTNESDIHAKNLFQQHCTPQILL